MIRIVVLCVGLFVLWVLFFSGFNKKRKTYLTVVVLLAGTFGLLIDKYRSTPRDGIVLAEQIQVCGVEAVYSYRTNFDITVCFENRADVGEVRRIRYWVTAIDCDSEGKCERLQRVHRDRQIRLLAKSSVSMTDNLSFDQVEPEATSVVWSVEVESAQATP